MNIQYASDLHYEMIAKPGYMGIEPARGADVLVLAGDIAVGMRAVDRFKDWPVPVIYVHGNHELYGCEDIGRAIADLRAACAAAGIHFLEKDALVVGDVRFLGTALWTDYCLTGKDQRDTNMLMADVFMSDTRQIHTQGRKMKAADFAGRHATARTWLKAQLASPFDGKTVVVTHHAPHAQSVPEGSKKKELRPCYATDLTEIMEAPGAPALWIHGHIHLEVDYLIHGTRVLANPRGYPAKESWPELSLFQNRAFDPLLTIEV